MKYYCNPINKQGEFADPFVLRHNGKYYLYSTTPDICCWSSDNLVDWELEGPTIEPTTFPSLVPFAPEVVYWNGAFYMYTSPHGLGHYVLKSESATGPFLKVTGNVAHNIDGSVFIDDDGKWYFYWADDSGILGCEMKSPTEFGASINTGAYMHGWTEGPLVIKENGMYFMTYTGNHYLSKGYRINVAASKRTLTGYKDCANNPIIVHTDEPFVGLGHSSTVFGPDMLTRYIVYHNINPDRSRDLNIDAIVFDGGIRVLGPTNFPQPVPRLPDFSDDMASDVSSGNWDVLHGMWSIRDGFRISSASFQCLCRNNLCAATGVIEFNLSVKGGDGSYGVIIGDNRIAMNTISNVIQLTMRNDALLHEHTIPCEYIHSALHCWQIRYNKNGATLYVDGRKTDEYAVSLGDGDRIGYFSAGPSIAMGYTAFSSGNTRTAAAKLYFPIPCTVPINRDKNINLNLNAAQTAEYVFAFTCDEIQKPETAFSATVDGNRAETVFIAASRDVAMYVLTLPQGLHEISIVYRDGLCCPSELSIFANGKNELVTEKIERFGPYDKKCLGDLDPPNFEAKLNFIVCPKSENASVGIMFRASELSEGGEGNDKRLGINFFIGYCISLEKDRIVLTKHRYNKRELISKTIRLSQLEKHSLCVRTEVNDIWVYIDDCDSPVMEYHDSSPILSGRTGIRTKDCEIEKTMFNKSSLY